MGTLTVLAGLWEIETPITKLNSVRRGLKPKMYKNHRKGRKLAQEPSALLLCPDSSMSKHSLSRGGRFARVSLADHAQHWAGIQ